MPFRDEPYVFSWDDAGIIPNQNIPPVIYGKALQTSDVMPYSKISDESLVNPSGGYHGGSWAYSDVHPTIPSYIAHAILALGLDWTRPIPETEEPTSYVTTNAEEFGYKHLINQSAWKIAPVRNQNSGQIVALNISAKDEFGSVVPVTINNDYPRFACGNVKVSLSNSVYGVASITFPPDRFTLPPIVTVSTARSGSIASYLESRVSSTKTAQSCSVIVTNVNGSATTFTVDVQWIAIQYSPTNAEG